MEHQRYLDGQLVIMNPNFSKKISHKIEALCAQGCTQVNQLLENAANEKNIVELAEFNDLERKQIIDELTQIMSVYNTDNIDTDDSDAGSGCK